MAATAHNDYEIAKTLTERGADVNARDHHGYTALRIASLQQSGTIVNILKQHGAK
jgi:ankyrin repeat protein